ncbi:MAG: hypothetical protein HRS57_02345 [Mycoplasmataceae bacterium]|nr:hypothetical protein [Mycoplasmataceae bacterium]
MISYLSTFIKRMTMSPGFIFLVVITPILLGVFPNLYEGIASPATLTALISTLSLTVAIISGWGNTLNLIKNSSIRVRLRTSGITDYMIIAMSLIPLLMLVVFAFLYLLIIISIFFSTGVIWNYYTPIVSGIPSAPYDTFAMSNIDWGSMFFGIITSILVSFSISFFVISFTNNQNRYNTITWLYILALYFFGGASTPPSLIRGPEAITAIKVISFFIPNSYSNFMVADVMVTGHNVSFSYSDSDTIINLCASYAFFAALTGLSVWNMKRWEF